jgi:hypothetical protein
LFFLLFRFWLGILLCKERCDEPDPTPATSLQERLAELCRLIALGLIRLRARQSSQASELPREIPLHNPLAQSGHAKPKRRRNV